MGLYRATKEEAVEIPQILKTYRKANYVQLTTRNRVREFFNNVRKTEFNSNIQNYMLF